MGTVAAVKKRRITSISRTRKGKMTDEHMTLRLAFDKTLQATIIYTISDGQVLMANTAAAKLLGYSKKELLNKTPAAIFDTAESSYKKMLQEKVARGRAAALVKAIRKNGRSFTCAVAIAVFTNSHGTRMAVSTLNDMSPYIPVKENMSAKWKKVVAKNISLAKYKQSEIDIPIDKELGNNIALAKLKQKKINVKNAKIVAENNAIALEKSNTRLAINNEWIKTIAKTSYDVMWDWDLGSQTIYIGDSVKEVFGYQLKKNTMTVAAFYKCLLNVERERVMQDLKRVVSSGSKKWKDSFHVKRRDGTIASTICRASIVYNDAGEVTRMIGAINDVTVLQELETKLQDQISLQAAQNEKFLLASRLSFDVIWDWDVSGNEVFIGTGFEELFGHRINNKYGQKIAELSGYIHPDDKKSIQEELTKCLHSTAMEWRHTCRLIRSDGSIAQVSTRANIIRHPDGKAYRLIGALQDISRQTDLEVQLSTEIRLKERQINEATDDAKEMERSTIGKELHDNINQLLGASRMYLEMALKGGKNSAVYLSRSSEYTLTSIEEIRKLTKGLTTDTIKAFGLCIAVNDLAAGMSELSPAKISCDLDEFNEKAVDDKFKLNIYRILQEHLNNIIKHAQASSVIVHLRIKENTVMLDITDDGIGFDPQITQKGIGLENIRSRTATYNGTADFVSKPGQGCVLHIRLPLTA